MTSDQWQAILLSVQVAATSTAISFPVAVALAAWLSRSRGPFRFAVEAITNLPLVLPPVVTGYLLLLLLGKGGPIGSFLFQTFGLEFIFDFKGAVLAAAIVSFPLMVRAMRLSFDEVDADLLAAAHSLGANPMRAFWSVKLPLAVRGLAAGSMLAFARSLGEFGATIMVAGSIAGRTKTVPLFIYEQLQRPGSTSNCWPVVVFSIFIAMLALLVSMKFENKPGKPSKPGAQS